jgi:RNA polymerase sigma factor (sigma-70 family)
MLHDSDDDGALIDASRTDPSCFASLFERHFDAVYAFCARRVGNDDAEDIAGETFCRAFASRHRYDLSHPDARPWLFGIALNVIKMALRSGARRARAYERHAGREARHVEMFTHHPVSLDAPAELARVCAALNRLPPDEAETLLLHVWEELSYEEVSRHGRGRFRARLGEARSGPQGRCDRAGPREG